MVLLLAPPERKRNYAARANRNPDLVTQHSRTQSLTQASSSTRRPCTLPAPPPLGAFIVSGVATIFPALISQPSLVQHITQASSERLHTASRPLPVHYQWQSWSAGGVTTVRRPQRPFILPRIRRSAHFPGLWRGG